MQTMSKHNLLVPLSTIGFGAFQIGRVPSEKYAAFGQPIPSENESQHLLNGVLDLGITLIDTAPAYGCSEERIGKYLSHRRTEYNLCTKVGEQTIDGCTAFDFSPNGMRTSVEQSLRTLKTDYIDILLIHAPLNDLSVLQQTDAVEMMLAFKKEGKTKAIGFSGKSIEAQKEAMHWSDALMIEYSAANQTNEPIITLAHEHNKLVLIKKAMNSGHLSGTEAIEFITKKSPIRNALHCTVIGSSNLTRMKKNVQSFTIKE